MDSAMLTYMDADREKKLVQLLNTYDTSGIAFPEAKSTLLAQGFTEAEIVYGLYSAPFDGKTNQPRPDNPLRALYEKNPEKADKVAKMLLLVQAQTDWNQTISYATASAVGLDMNTRAHYDVRLADRLGIPYFRLLFAGLIFEIIALAAFKAPAGIAYGIGFAYSMILNSWVAYRLFQERRRINRLRKESK